jgi:dihydroorotate dehydrogenase (NAD+) catalytic subunit
MVWQVAAAVKIPVIGIGGIMCAEDVIEFLIAGATAVEIGTANFVNPCITMEIIDGLARYMEQNKISRITDLINTLIIP